MKRFLLLPLLVTLTMSINGQDSTELILDMLVTDDDGSGVPFLLYAYEVEDITSKSNGQLTLTKCKATHYTNVRFKVFFQDKKDEDFFEAALISAPNLGAVNENTCALTNESPFSIEDLKSVERFYVWEDLRGHSSYIERLPKCGRKRNPYSSSEKR